ncbi:replication initiation and membrane attachment family protein [Loigolactobacillus jiayinensis]|uniref:Replication initiation and membrane attachment family protein n=1 Tax=Loigolactobacillus jiayinensis TaxID=2486016 RepID=A0ABW1RGJ2_9LACO|nr:DnaD domain protein [Loigolactobacillus jiayinensis]
MQDAFFKLDPRDGFAVTAADYLSDFDRQVLTYLYQPLMGTGAYSLYLLLWTQPTTVQVQPHSALLALLNVDLPTLYDSRIRLEALGLVKTYQQVTAAGRTFTYELYAPQAPTAFFTDDLLSLLLYDAVGEDRFDQMKAQFQLHPVKASAGWEEVSLSFLDVFHVNSQLLAQPPATIAEAKSTFQTTTQANQPQLDQRATADFDWPFFKQQLQASFVSVRELDHYHDQLLTLHALYGLTELELARYVNESIDLNTNKLDWSALKRLVARQPTKVAPTTAPAATNEATATTTTQTDLSKNDQQLIAVSRQLAPVTFLTQLKQQQGGYVTDSEQRVLERLTSRHVFADPSIINILSHYVISVRKMPTLTQAYVDGVANGWLQHHVTTPEAAMKEVKSFYRQKQAPKRNSRTKQPLRKETLPDWAKDGYQAPKQKVTAAQRAAVQKRLAALQDNKDGE